VFHAPAELLARLAAHCRRVKVAEAEAIRAALDEFLTARKS
jgi:hypothetical protein